MDNDPESFFNQRFLIIGGITKAATTAVSAYLLAHFLAGRQKKPARVYFYDN